MSAEMLSLVLALAVAAPGPPADAASAGSADTAARAELEALRATLEAVVTGTRRPASGTLATAPRVYRLEGYGAMVVLAPRVLPRVRRPAADRQGSRAMAEAVRSLEDSLRTVRNPDLRRQIQETLAALRSAQGEPPARPAPAAGAAPEPQSPAVLTVVTDPAAEVDFVRVHEQAEAFRREADLARERAEREIRVTLGIEAPPPAPEAPMPAAAPLPPLPDTPATLPWRQWVDTDDSQEGPEEAFGRIRAALARGLARHPGSLASLGRDEFVVVAVDFIPRFGDARKGRTVLARVRRRDLDARREGAISADELLNRIAFEEF